MEGAAGTHKCKGCEYKNDIWLFITTCVKYDFTNDNIQTLCAFLDVPIEKPGEWTLLDSAQTYVRPSVLWALKRLGIIENFRKLPNKLEEEILKKVLQREDLATIYQELLDQYRPTVILCLQRFRSEDISSVSGTEVIPAQETAGIHAIEEETRSERRPSSGFDDEYSLRPRSVSCVTTDSNGSVSTNGSSTHIERIDSGVSVASKPKMKRDCDSNAEISQPTNIDSILASFCTDCRAWIKNTNPQGSPGLLNSPEGSCSLSSASSSPLPCKVQTTISGKMEVKKSKLIKNLESSKCNWSHMTTRFPDIKEVKGPSMQYCIKLHPHMYKSAATNQSCATLSLELHPVSRDTVHISPMTVIVSVYVTNDKAAMTGFNIANAKQNVEEATIRESTEIAQFPELISLDLLKRIEEKDIVTEVNIIYT